MSMDSIAALIIAAGSSSRLGQPKQLLVFAGETLLQRAIRLPLEAGAKPVFVVLGAHREQIEPRVDFHGTKIVFNGNWQEGMASSIRIGIQALKAEAPDAGGVLLMICDQPAVTAEHLGRMLAVFRRNPTNAVASEYAGKRGIPVIFPSHAFSELLELRGDQGARGLLSDPERTVIELRLENGDIDIESPEDLSRLQSR
jgi:molybdenum cofactor cytidylyltransferase